MDKAAEFDADAAFTQGHTIWGCNFIQIGLGPKIGSRQVGGDEVGIGAVGIGTGQITQLRNGPPEQTVHRVVAIV
eukprot:scaffold19187_cov69-Attheya_sp.AAC.3